MSKKPPTRSKQERQRQTQLAGGGLGLILILAFVSILVRERPYQSTTGSGAYMRDLTPCPEVEEDEVGHVLCRSPTAIAAFNAPATMTRGEQQVISLILTAQASGKELTEQIRTATGDTTSKVELDTVRVSPRMVARLEGQGFDVTPKAADATPVAVSTHGRTEWDWQVKPTASGDQLLVLTLDAIVRLKAGDAPVRQTVLRRRIHVNVRMRDKFSDWADWIVAHWQLFAVLGGALVVGYGLWKSRRKWYPLK